MRYQSSILVSFILLGAELSGCQQNASGPEYRISAAQAQWRGYQVGEQLRFGHAKDGKVRTYRITELKDYMDTQWQQSGWLPVPKGEPPTYQHLEARAERTDSAAGEFMAFEAFMYTPRGGDTLELRAECHWERSQTFYLPLDAANQGSVSSANVTLLPNVTLGSISYGPTLRLSAAAASVSRPDYKVIRQVYLAKGKGVVAFEEDGTGLWYRLP